MGPRIAVQLSPGGVPSYAAWRDAVLRAEQIGVDVILGSDHFFKPVLPSAPEPSDPGPEANNFEAWTALGSWGEVTSKAEIGLLVGGIGFRNPDLLADMARTVDHISDGRLILGLGAGWYERDYTDYGYEFPSLGKRMDIFAAGLERVTDRLANLTPAPVRDIPILIGGWGEKRTLPLVGRYADIWHISVDFEDFRRRSDLVAEHAAAAGRDDSKIERSITWTGAAEADAFRDEGVGLFISLAGATDAGFDLGEVEAMAAWRAGA
jgi:probable F420-dependent oxidoreductase